MLETGVGAIDGFEICTIFGSSFDLRGAAAGTGDADGGFGAAAGLAWLGLVSGSVRLPCAALPASGLAAGWATAFGAGFAGFGVGFDVTLCKLVFA